ncbi:sigma-54-dependent transcriptional regulator [Algiphilus aromaticivorans]|uniref:sigma-54-dependent transcriptional regulator n=1 Tax=Algiphilus aromaticivorans TaxID=382454 RepID=UPI0022B3FF85|nr:sigma-54 dependent transcriptional regulator [Algiphilus aromaticivorans]
MRILTVDDEPSMLRVLQIMLERMGHECAGAGNGLEAMEMLRNDEFDLVISDLRMPELDGVGLLRTMREEAIHLPLIMISAHGSIDAAVGAMKLGAIDFLQRPFDRETLELAIERVVQQGWMLRANRFLRDQVTHSGHGLVGASAGIQAVRRAIDQVGPTQASVLITGETGTGKEVVARAIHAASERSENLFVPINCAAIPADMLESELFGHERGAFTGAVSERVGRFELASGGTLFLDELTEMPMALQAKLLRVLQEQTVERLGSNRSRQLDLRVLAATNRDPAEAVSAGLLRTDLLYRLDVFRIALPPLRERPDDIVPLTLHLIEQSRGARPVPRIGEALAAHLRAYDWPGNVRELRNVVERALILAGDAELLDLPHFPLKKEHAQDAPETDADAITSFDLAAATDALEVRYLRAALAAAEENKTRAASLLGISERTLWYKLKKHALRRSDDGAAGISQ